jgi:hypothetical protein
MSLLVVGYTRNGSTNPFIKENPELELFIHQNTNKSYRNSILGAKSGKVLNLTSLDPPNGQWKRYLIEESPNTTQATSTQLEIKLLRPLDTSHIFIR